MSLNGKSSSDALCGRKGAPASFDGHGECFIEAGNMRTGFGSGNFYAEPAPDVMVRQPSVARPLTKVLFEKQWLRRWF